MSQGHGKKRVDGQRLSYESKTANSLNALEIRNDYLLKHNSSLKREHGQLESRVASDAELIAREKELMGTKVRSMALSLETQIASATATATARSECDGEKRG
jgi:hypothetical protein